jgi:predicted dehydrogenase
MAKLRLGMVGCGGISHAHGIGVNEHLSRAQFVACCDVEEDRAKEWANTYGCTTTYTDYNEMFAAEELDGVVLATWPNQHRQQIEDCVKGGIKNILCEKALTVTGQEAVECFDMVTDAGVFLMEGFMYRHHPAMRKMKELIDAGSIGPVDAVRACFSEFDGEEEDANDPNRNWRRDPARAGGIPYDFSCYCVNCTRFLADGVPTRIRTYGGVSDKYKTINRVYSMLEYDNGVVGYIEGSKNAAFKQDVEVTGKKAVLSLPVGWTILNEQDITRRFAVGWANLREDKFFTPNDNAFIHQTDNFLGVIEGTAKPRVKLAETVINSFTIEAKVASLVEDREVDINIPDHIVAALREA